MAVLIGIMVYLTGGFLLAAFIKRKWGIFSGVMLFSCMMAAPMYLYVVVWCLINSDDTPQPFLKVTK